MRNNVAPNPFSDLDSNLGQEKHSTHCAITKSWLPSFDDLHATHDDPFRAYETPRKRRFSGFLGNSLQ